MKYFLISFALFLNSCCSAMSQNEHIIYKPGDITYSYERGKIQCLAEKDSHGHVFILLKSLAPNTIIEFENVALLETGKYLVKAVMIINKENSGFKSFQHHQSVTMVISPTPVETTTLRGTVVLQNFLVQVLID